VRGTYRRLLAPPAHVAGCPSAATAIRDPSIGATLARTVPSVSASAVSGVPPTNGGTGDPGEHFERARNFERRDAQEDQGADVEAGGGGDGGPGR
jgi:hypothetical protein